MRLQSTRGRLLASTIICGAALAAAAPAFAQAAQETTVEAVVITGSRISVPGIQSASPIVTVGAEEIQLQQQPEVEKILRFLPVTVPGDGDAVNNGTAGVSTVNLRGLGAQRNLIMVDGKRVTPYDSNGAVDVSTIPTAFLERIDVITGGASAVYGSDAISGAINFILKKDFEGVEAALGYSVTGEEDGERYNASISLGANSADGRGNVAITANYSKREGVTLAQRPLGQLGIVTADGANYQNFLDGVAPTPPADPLCQGPGAVAAGGSSTTIPTRTQITGVGTSARQFRTDGSLGANCSRFNFNPFNYYQTPQERFGGMAIGHYEINDSVEAYARVSFSKTTVRQQIAPSGIFGSSFFVPLANPFLTASARATLISLGNTARLAAQLNASNWRDLNLNNLVDAPDDLSLVIRRRTVEFGPRSTTYTNQSYQMLFGLQGTLFDNWDWDVSYSRGESSRENISAGYTNVTNFGNALNSVDGVTCRGGQPGCVPINVFGGYGTITQAMAAYSSATAIQTQNYTQQIASATIGGSVAAVQSPYADAPRAVSLGVEYREENGESIPDECLKLAPASCLGGAGGNTLPLAGGFSTKEIFGEAIIPLISGKTFAQSLDLELGYRYSDYDPSGVNKTWKYGFSWTPVDSVRFRVMQQRASRAPNVGELAAPLVTGLRNATEDPCSVTNAVALAGNAALRARCVSTGMTLGQVGTVQDIVSGQIGTFEGTDLVNLPTPETADTTTVGVVWTPTMFTALKHPVVSLDYYDIKVNDYIGIFGPQEILDGCYILAQAADCAKIVRVNGDLASPAAGIKLYTTNLKYIQAEGVELGMSAGVDMETLGFDPSWGSLEFSYNANLYLTNESQSSQANAPIDCLGYFGVQCGNPTSEFRFIQRTTWSMGDLRVSYLWRHMSEVGIEPGQVAGTFAAFRKIEAYDYLDLVASYQVTDAAKLTIGVNNVFEKEPPVLGNEAATTSANSGNTLPSAYDVLGRVFTVGLNLRF